MIREGGIGRAFQQLVLHLLGFGYPLLSSPAGRDFGHKFRYKLLKHTLIASIAYSTIAVVMSKASKANGNVSYPGTNGLLARMC